MSMLEHIKRLTAEAQSLLPRSDAGLYGLTGLQYPPSAKLAEYAIGSGQQEPTLQLSEGTLPSGSYVVATLRGDAALCTRALSHIDVDDELLPPAYRYDIAESELAELLADRVDHAWQLHLGQPPDWAAVYRTHAGWRILLPWHADAHLASLLVPGVDPRYVFVCIRQQGRHRIRILRKPWRDDETIVADRVLFRGSAPVGDSATVLRFHDAVACATVGAQVGC